MDDTSFNEALVSITTAAGQQRAGAPEQARTLARAAQKDIATLSEWFMQAVEEEPLMTADDVRRTQALLDGICEIYRDRWNALLPNRTLN